MKSSCKRVKKRLATVAVMISMASLAAAQSSSPPPSTAPAVAPAGARAAAPVEPVADETSSYGVGLNYGHQLYNSGLEHALSTDALLRGLKDGLAGKGVSTQDQASANQLLRQGRDWLTVRNRTAAKEFLATNAAVSGVTTTASGLQYRVLSPGDSKAAPPGANDRVTVRYVARLIDGTEFDKSETHGDQPTTFGLNGIIQGWHEALLLMKPGAKWRVFIPPALAFDSNSPAAVPPGSLIIADLELLRIDAPPVVRRAEHKKSTQSAAK